jgi:hypothetical protein
VFSSPFCNTQADSSEWKSEIALHDYITRSTRLAHITQKVCDGDRHRPSSSLFTSIGAFVNDSKINIQLRRQHTHCINKDDATCLWYGEVGEGGIN